jgi:hypothetical protein
MAGTLVITTLSDGTNTTSATNLVKAPCVAWINYKGTATVSIRASYNVSSVTVNGTGDYTINFTNALADANYAAGGMLSWTNGVNASGAVSIRTDAGTPTASAFRINCVGQNGTAYDRDYVLVSVFR